MISKLSSYPLRAFLKSVLFGALTGALPVLLLVGLMNVASLMYNGITGDGVLAALMILVLPLAVALPIVAVASLLIGVPVTMFLSRRGWENAGAYMISGAFFGGAIPLVWLVWNAISGSHQVWLSLMGAAGGAATARTWWIDARSPCPPMPSDPMLDGQIDGSNAHPMGTTLPSARSSDDERPRT